MKIESVTIEWDNGYTRTITGDLIGRLEIDLKEMTLEEMKEAAESLRILKREKESAFAEGVASERARSRQAIQNAMHSATEVLAQYMAAKEAGN